MIARVTDRQLWYGIAAGLLVIMGWYAATRTTLLLAYGNGGTLTLHQVQGICDSAIGQIGRALPVPAAVNCGSVDGYAKWLNVTGVAGLFLTVTCGAFLRYRIEHRPASSQ
ncbi:MAG TPA: hypothetical protein VGQ26_08895 [Streptosporangiaceae bacterium]|jgi:hypothetical protein|nr:hypothetical protein [Streptosporangiaceae bacterium]